ncbi:MAG: hypothetical protein AB4426_28220, partial [Xenococcaceae cyanobacterium]
RRYKPGEFAEKVNRTVATLRIWDKTGKLPAKRHMLKYPQGYKLMPTTLSTTSISRAEENGQENCPRMECSCC